MRHWSQLGIRNWRVRPGRTACALAAIALGVGVVVWVTCAYESVRLALVDQVWFWIGRSHLSVESMYGLYGVIPEQIAEDVAKDPNVAAVTARLKHGMEVLPLGRGPRPGLRPESEQPGGIPVQKAGGLPGQPGAGMTVYDQEAGKTPAPSSESTRYSAREQVFDWNVADDADPTRSRQVVAVGIDPRTEAEFRSFNEENITGRLLKPGDTNAAVLDREVAESLGLKIGDRFVLRNVTTGEAPPAHEREGVLTVVGLIDMHRVAKRQKPIVIAPLRLVQELTGKLSPAPSVTRVDLLLKDPSPTALRATRARIQKLVQTKYRSAPAMVTSAEAKLRQIKTAERQTQFVLLLISTVALFTAFFVILSTLSMGMVERIGQLGMLRCLGMTRLQIAGLVLAEAVPLGMTGILLGIPVGFGFARLSVWLAPEYIGRFEVSHAGLLLALAGGAATTLLGALVPMVQAMRVSPLSASRPQARNPSALPVAAAAVLGVVLIAAHGYLINHTVVTDWFMNEYLPVMAASLLYGGYALLAPALVLTLGALAVRAAAGILRIRYRLLADQVGRAVWRSSAICCGLMVGLSLVVSVVVFSQSMASGWNFPKDFCEAFIYMSAPVPYAKADQARKISGAGRSALVNEQLQCRITGRGLLDFGFTRFVAGDPEQFFRIATLVFVEGNQEDAVRKLKRGGHVLVTPEFCRAQRVKMGDRIHFSAGGRTVPMTIAGVVTSPALDIAANYFNAGEAMTMAAAYVVLGTLDDLQKYFNLPKEATLFLVDFDLKGPPDAAPPPPAFAADDAPKLTDAADAARLFVSWRAAMPERAKEIDAIEAQLHESQAEGGRLNWAESEDLRLFRDAMDSRLASDWRPLGDAAMRWRAYREDLVMRLIARATGTPAEHYGSVSVLKAQIDHDLRRATVLFATVPLVALIVAALGVGNLMMANVVSRTRQIAMLRAIGATREQITRLVMGEALVLGILGCLLGVALGLHMAESMSEMTERIWGYQAVWTIPHDLVSAAIGFTLGVCLVAGLIPALRASRSNVIDALQAT
jgi:ABC-type lipoprotein release transport system permease subunit